MLSVFFILCFFVCLVRCLLSFFAVLLFSGSLSEKIFGSELLFLGGLVGLVFFGGVLPMFLLHFLAVRFRKCLKNSLDVRSGVFLGSFFLPFVFPSTSFFVFVFSFFVSRDIAQVVTGHPHTHLFSFVLFFLCCPAAFVCSALFGRASRFLAFLRGAILGPARFWDSPGTCSEAPFSWDARRQGCFLASCPWFAFSPLFCSAASHV